MATILPTFQGYTMDVRVREFRKVNHPDCDIEWVPFNSPKGRQLLEEFEETVIAPVLDAMYG